MKRTIISGLVSLIALIGTAFVTVPAQATTYCATTPATCGFPQGSTTGYIIPLNQLTQVPQQATSGNGWSYSNGTITVTGTNAVLDKISTAAGIDVRASGVTINQSRVYGALTGSPGIGLEPAANNTTIENTLIAGTNPTNGTMLVGVKDVQGTPVTGTVINKCNIYNTSSGIQIYQGTIENSYIHDLGNTGTEHLEDYNSTGNSGYPVTIFHNTLLNRQSQTAAVYEGADFSPSQNITVNDNLLAGGGYTVYGGGIGVGSQADPMNIVFTNNIFSQIYFANYGSYGPDAYYDSGNGDVWSGNTSDNGTKTGTGTVGP